MTGGCLCRLGCNLLSRIETGKTNGFGIEKQATCAGFSASRSARWAVINREDRRFFCIFTATEEILLNYCSQVLGNLTNGPTLLISLRV